MEEKKLTDEELKKAFFILRHGSSEGLSEYVKAVLAIESEYNRQKAEIERLKDENIEQRDIHFKNLCGYKDEIARLNAKYLNLEINYNAVWEDFRKYEVENAELQKQVDELKDERENMQAEIMETEELRLQAVKDTAKEICDLILEHWGKKQFVECDWLRVAISEKYGVEVE